MIQNLPSGSQQSVSNHLTTDTHRYLNMNDLKEHKKIQLRQA
jgi:hypothetical protein